MKIDLGGAENCAVARMNTRFGDRDWVQATLVRWREFLRAHLALDCSAETKDYLCFDFYAVFSCFELCPWSQLRSKRGVSDRDCYPLAKGHRKTARPKTDWLRILLRYYPQLLIQGPDQYDTQSGILISQKRVRQRYSPNGSPVNDAQEKGHTLL